MAIVHPVSRTDVDLGGLADELLAALGVGDSVELGHGELRVLTAAGEALDVDPAVVQNALASHVPRPPELAPVEVLAQALQAAVSLADVLAALRTWADAQAEIARAARPTGRGPVRG